MDMRIKAISFNEEEHIYMYNGKFLHGITGAIGKLLDKSFPETDIVKMATLYGSDVHKEIENYYNNNSGVLSTEAAKWVNTELNNFVQKNCKSSKVVCEVMVSDFIGTASKVDIVLHNNEGGVYLFDIKTTSHFDREYCSLQLSVYKKLYEVCYDEKVEGMYVIGTNSKRFFHILDKGPEKVNKILAMNMEG